jgi:choline dehydrogenase-like flavoprotein
VVVVGSGAGGAACAKELAEAGIDTVVLEAGPSFGAKDVDQREETTIPRLYSEGGLRGTFDRSILIVQGRGVGGSTLHNTGLCIRAPDGILDRWRKEFGLSLDLAARMERVERHLGARPVREEEITPPNQALRDGARALGWRWLVANHNRTDCEGCGYCVLGCAYNRKNGMSLTYVPRAVAAGARVIPCARVESIRSRSRGVLVRARLTDPLGAPLGTGLEVEAEAVVVAAGAIDTPAILQANGLGKQRLIGKSLRLHPSLPVAGIFPRAMRSFRGVPQSVLLVEKASFFEHGHGGSIVLPAFGHPATTALLAPGLGREHWEVMRSYDRMAGAGVVLHDETKGTVTRTWLRGTHRPVIRYWPDPSEQRALTKGALDLARVWFAGGAEAVILPFLGSKIVRSLAELEALSPDQFRFEPHTVSLSSVHPQGTVPMGRDETRAPVDERGALRGTDDAVWLADTSLFPTSVGVPPQITTAALATHVASELAARLAKGPRA